MSVILPLSIDVAHLSGISEVLARNLEGASAVHVEAHALLTCLYGCCAQTERNAATVDPMMCPTHPGWLFIDTAERIGHFGRGFLMI